MTGQQTVTGTSWGAGDDGGHPGPGRMAGSGLRIEGMSSAPPWIRRSLLLALLAAATVAVTRTLGTRGPDGGLVPSIGGDTWPPVPVKDVRPG